MTDHGGRWFKRGIPGLVPLGGTSLNRIFSQINVGPEPADQVIDIASQVEEIDLSIHERSIGADDERTTQGQPLILDVDTEEARYLPSGVGSHGELGIFEHAFVIFPCQVYEFGVSADGIDLSAEFLEFIVPLCQSGKLGRSNKGEVSGIKEEDGPLLLLFLVGQTHLAEIAFGRFVCIQLKVRDFLSNLNSKTAAIFHG